MSRDDWRKSGIYPLFDINHSDVNHVSTLTYGGCCLFRHFVHELHWDGRIGMACAWRPVRAVTPLPEPEH
jgi:hypothetical protein